MIDIIKKLFNKKQEEINICDTVENLFEKTFTTDIIRFELGSDIAELGDDIKKIISEFREKTADNLGFIFPLVHLLGNPDLQENQIKIFIQEKEILDEYWIPNLETVSKEIETKLDYIYQNHLDEIFSNDFFEKIFNRVQAENGWLIWNISCWHTISDMRKVFINILKQKKSIKNINYIFEKIAECSPSMSSDNLAKAILKEI